MGQIAHLVSALTMAMYNQQSLITAAILVGLLAYLGTAVISPGQITLRRVVAYFCGFILALIGVMGIGFGLSRVLEDLYVGAASVDIFRVEWLGVGVIALTMGVILVRQGFLRR